LSLWFGSYRFPDRQEQRSENLVLLGEFKKCYDLLKRALNFRRSCLERRIRQSGPQARQGCNQIIQILLKGIFRFGVGKKLEFFPI